MNGISRRNHRKPDKVGEWSFGWGQLSEPLVHALGGVFCDWGFVEIQMDALLSATIKHAGAGKVLRQELRSSKQRRAVIAGLINVSTPEDMREQVSMIVGDFNRLAGERGLYAHGQWGTHSAYPEEGVLLLDDSALEALYPDMDRILAGTNGNFMERVKANAALVSKSELEQFRSSLKRLSDRLAATISELGRRTRNDQIRAMAALEHFSSASLEANSLLEPDAQFE